MTTEGVECLVCLFVRRDEFEQDKGQKSSYRASANRPLIHSDSRGPLQQRPGGARKILRYVSRGNEQTATPSRAHLATRLGWTTLLGTAVNGSRFAVRGIVERRTGPREEFACGERGQNLHAGQRSASSRATATSSQSHEAEAANLLICVVRRSRSSVWCALAFSLACCTQPCTAICD